MNQLLVDFSKTWLKENLNKLIPDAQHKFKQMYAKGNFDLDINEVVDRMDEDKLDWAMNQVERTLQLTHCLI